MQHYHGLFAAYLSDMKSDLAGVNEAVLKSGTYLRAGHTPHY
jgi:hypothetical protein